MNRRPWTVVLLLAVAVAVTGCETERAPDSDRLAGELAEVKADRDHLAALVQQLSTTSATLEAYTINDRQGCLGTLKAVRQRIAAARARLGDGAANGGNAARQLDSAGRGLDAAIRGDCAPAVP
jgi:hypothetical protein